MDVLPAIALLLGAVGSVLAVFATVRGQVTNANESKLSLAWAMQEKALDDLREENKDLRTRARTCDEELFKVLRELGECKEGRRQLEIQVELLKLGREGHR